MKFLDAVVENLERRFPDIPLLVAFAAFNTQQWPELEAELQMFGCDSIQVKEKNCVYYLTRCSCLIQVHIQLTNCTLYNIDFAAVLICLHVLLYIYMIFSGSSRPLQPGC